MSSEKIKVIVDTIYRETDTNGNRYWLATFTRVSDGVGVRFLVNDDGHARGVARKLFKCGFRGVHETIKSMSYRDFNGMAKGLKHLRCNAEEAAKTLREAFKHPYE